MEALPIILFWLIAFWGILGRQEVLIYFFFCSMSFGSFAVVPPEMTAGLTLTPTPMVALIIIFRQLVGHRAMKNVLGMAMSPKHLLLLFLFWAVATIMTVSMPRLFAGQITIIPMRLEGSTYGEPLEPTPQNVSQFVYLTISVWVVPVFARILSYPAMRKHAMVALVAGGCIVVFTGLLDFLTQFLPIQPLLEPFRTATYALLTGDIVVGTKRVVGLMPEASTYGGLVLDFLSAIYFLRGSMRRGATRDRIVPVLIPMLMLAVWLSTSSSAYIGFVVFCIVAALEWLWRAMVAARGHSRRRRLATEFWIVAGVVSIFCIILLVRPGLLDPIIEMIDAMVFQKTSTGSFEERSMWTAVSWQALLDSYGLGVGLGSTRASNGAVAIFSSAGVVGGCLYFAFVAQTFLRRPPRGYQHDQAMAAEVFWCFLPPFTGNILAGTTPNFGVFNGFLFALALAMASSVRFRREQLMLTSGPSHSTWHGPAPLPSAVSRPDGHIASGRARE